DGVAGRRVDDRRSGRSARAVAGVEGLAAVGHAAQALVDGVDLAAHGLLRVLPEADLLGLPAGVLDEPDGIADRQGVPARDDLAPGQLGVPVERQQGVVETVLLAARL